MFDVALLVIAKEPVPGRVKTRLTPPFTPEQAAQLARAALLDTLDVVARTPVRRKVLIFDGDAGAWRRPGLELISQRGHGLDDRLASAFEDVGGPALLVGMDTPQLTSGMLLDGINALGGADIDAVLGPASDGGYWSIGLKQPLRAVFAGVPMSLSTTLAHQRERLHDLGLAVHEQSTLRDVDTAADARAVALEAPGTRFAAALAMRAGTAQPLRRAA